MIHRPNEDVSGEMRHRAAAELIAAALREGRDIRLRTWGTSMLPAIWPGDVVLVSPSGAAPLARGAIVLFLRNGRLFAHRVVDRRGDQLTTRGDALPDCDPPVAAPDLLGIVTAIITLDGASRAVRAATPLRHRVVAFAIRHSRVARRLALKWDSLLKRSFRSPKSGGQGLARLGHEP